MSQPAEAPDSRHLIEVQSTLGKGKGIFAKTTIPRGTRIIAEPALLSTSFGFDAESILNAYNGLTAADQNSYSSLASHASTAFKSRIEKGFHCEWARINERVREVLCIAVTNKFPQGVFELGSRINHSCIPNVNFAFNTNLTKGTFHAVRQIDTGEELTLSYIDGTNLTRKERQTRLQTWGFQCRCPACEVGPEAHRQDAQRGRLFKLGQKLSILDELRLTDEGSLNEGVRTAQTVAGMKIALGLVTQHLSANYHQALKYSVKLGNRDMVVLWAEKQRQHEIVCLGADHPVCKETLEMVSHLKNLADIETEPINEYVMKWVDPNHSKPGVSLTAL